MDDVEGCFICDKGQHRKIGDGGILYETDHWYVDHSIGPFPLGTLMLLIKRHCLHIWDMTDAEAAELGPLMRHVSGSIPQIVEADQVYCFLWSHMNGQPGHIHYVMQPARNVDWGKDIQFEYPGLEAVEGIADRARDVLQGRL